MELICHHTSDVTFECRWPNGNFEKYTINDKTITWDPNPTKFKGTYYGKNTIKWNTGKTWVKQEQGMHSILNHK